MAMTLEIGYKQNMLTVKSFSHHEKGIGNIYLCECDCGKNIKVSRKNLLTNRNKSCGCLSKTHNMSSHKLATTWAGMMSRCYKKEDISYKNYGGRGITVCDKWHYLPNFIEDMSPKPEGCTLDRIDNSKGYSPDNCKWSTYSDQSINRRKRKNKSGYTGVYSHYNKFRCSLTRDKITRVSKNLDTKEEAIKLRKEWEEEYKKDKKKWKEKTINKSF